jgi:hypothetical protein
MDIKNTTQTGGSKMNLTEKETKAIETILENSNLEDDCSCVWAQPIDLIDSGYSKHEAAGLWSSLLEKGALDEDEKRSKADGGDLFILAWDLLPQWKQIEINEQNCDDRPITSNHGTVSPR